MKFGSALAAAAAGIGLASMSIAAQPQGPEGLSRQLEKLVTANPRAIKLVQMRPETKFLVTRARTTGACSTTFTVEGATSEFQFAWGAADPISWAQPGIFLFHHRGTSYYLEASPDHAAGQAANLVHQLVLACWERARQAASSTSLAAPPTAAASPRTSSENPNEQFGLVKQLLEK